VLQKVCRVRMGVQSRFEVNAIYCSSVPAKPEAARRPRKGALLRRLESVESRLPNFARVLVVIGVK
jgi:hypothetical protein